MQHRRLAAGGGRKGEAGGNEESHHGQRADFGSAGYTIKLIKKHGLSIYFHMVTAV